MTTVSRRHKRRRRFLCPFAPKPGVSSIVVVVILVGSLLQIRTSFTNPYLTASTVLGIGSSNNNNNNIDDDQQQPSSSSSSSLGPLLDRRRQQSTNTTTIAATTKATTATLNTQAAATTTRIIHRHDQRLDHTATATATAVQVQVQQREQQQQQQPSEPAWAPRFVWLEPKENSSSLQQLHRTVVEPLGGPCPYCERDPYDYIWPMERPYYDECTPMADWQTRFYPTCNLFHEMSLGDASIFNNITEPTATATATINSTTSTSVTPQTPQQQRTQTDTLQLLSMSGSWRSAWQRTTKALNETIVLKLLKLTSRTFDHESFEHHRIDAVVMERLTHSPYIVSAFGYCGQSIMTEYASGTAREHTKNKHLNSRERLKMGRDLARAVAQLHSMDYPNSTNATFAHNDINIANAVQVNGRIKLNDFNIGHLLRWNQTHNKPCGVPVRFEAPLWKSPEENANTSYVDAAQADIYGLGNLLFQVLTARQPWTHLEPGGKLTPEQVAVKKAVGAMPYIPLQIVQSPKIGIQALYFATAACFRFNPVERPTSHELAVNLNVALQWARLKANVTRSQVEELFAVKPRR